MTIFKPTLTYVQGRHSLYLAPDHVWPVGVYTDLETAVMAYRFLTDTYHVDEIGDDIVVMEFDNGALSSRYIRYGGVDNPDECQDVLDRIEASLNEYMSCIEALLNKYMSQTSAYDDHNLVVGGANNDA